MKNFRQNNTTEYSFLLLLMTHGTWLMTKFITCMEDFYEKIYINH